MPYFAYASFGAGVYCFALGKLATGSWVSGGYLSVLFLYGFTTFFPFGVGAIILLVPAEVYWPQVESFCSMFSWKMVYVYCAIVYFLGPLISIFYPPEPYLVHLLSLNKALVSLFNDLGSAFGLGSGFYVFANVFILNAIYRIYKYSKKTGLKVNVIQAKSVEKRAEKQQNSVHCVISVHV